MAVYKEEKQILGELYIATLIGRVNADNHKSVALLPKEKHRLGNGSSLIKQRLIWI